MEFTIDPQVAKQIALAVGVAAALAVPLSGFIDAIKALFPDTQNPNHSRLGGAATIAAVFAFGAFLGFAIDGISLGVGVLSSFIAVWGTSRIREFGSKKTYSPRTLL